MERRKEERLTSEGKALLLPVLALPYPQADDALYKVLWVLSMDSLSIARSAILDSVSKKEVRREERGEVRQFTVTENVFL